MKVVTCFVQALTLSLLTTAPLRAATYHLSSIDGNDNRTIEQATQEATPWKTFSRLKIQTLNAGDRILLKRGSVWRDSLVINASGQTNLPITIDAYGSGNLPEIRGTDRITTAIQIKGEAVFSAPQGVIYKALYSDTNLIPVIRYPAEGFRILESGFEGDSAVKIPALSSANLAGATIHLRTLQWAFETRKIIRANQGRLVFDRPVTYTSKNTPYYISNYTDSTLSTDATKTYWYQSRIDNSLRCKAGSQMIVEASIRSNGINVSNQNNIHIRNVKIFGTTKQAILANKSSGIVIENCIIRYPGTIGINIGGTANLISKNNIKGASNSAINSNGELNKIIGNSLKNTAVLHALGPDGISEGCCGGKAINSTGDSSIIRKNRVDSSGSSGIFFMGAGAVIDSNYLQHGCMLMDDCGGIRTWSGKYADNHMKSANSRISMNVIQNTVGAPTGTPEYYPAYQGIYLDDGSHDILIQNNMISGNYDGIYLHNNQRIAVIGNVLFNNKRAQIHLEHDAYAGPEDMRDNIINDNQLISLDTQRDSISIINQQQSLPLASWSNNTHCFDVSAEVRCLKNGEHKWNHLRNFTYPKHLEPETQLNVGFDSTANGWIAFPIGDAIKIESGSVCGNPTNKCLQHKYLNPTMTKPQNLTNAKLFPSSEGALWRLSFRAKSAYGSTNLSAAMRQGYGAFKSVAPWSTIKLDSTWKQYKVFLISSMSDSNVRLDFFAEGKDSTYWIDDVSLQEVRKSTLDTIPRTQVFYKVKFDDEIMSHTNLATHTWYNTNKQYIAKLPTTEFEGTVAFPLDIQPVIAPPKVLQSQYTAPIRARKQGTSWLLTGVQGACRVFNSNGQLIESLPANQAEMITWKPYSNKGVFTLKTPSQTLKLISID